MTDLEAAQSAYEQVWASSDYTNVLNARYILATAMPAATQPWREFLRRCDQLLENVDPNTRWDLAGKLLGKKNGKLFGDVKPAWTEPLPPYLWTSGIGLCTSFAIATNGHASIDAAYIEYPAAHRIASKSDESQSAVVIDSGPGYAFELAEGESISNWENRSGNVWWRNGGKMIKPVNIATAEEAMKLCLDQLWKKCRCLLVLHRGPVVDACGTWGAMTMFSGFHRAFRLQETARDGFVSIRYIVFSKGSLEDLDDCMAILTDWMMLRRPLMEETAKRLLSEMLELFSDASDLWGSPRVSIAERVADDGKAHRSWPDAKFEES
ncbi:uncharacterized protein J4E87_011044 [Alternaria ethzedia]|uniref:uncharacterized protein n=1 Tax=Alternaria ethzedia TaxID=181014 RepID=UPI0020C3F7DE|nr:uncharacterized protein J4E87_011044 [Alternaria ethzedia]KAI4609586.1 hypothetical protein J4E87_011044 [Alternaria ethzedia]